MDQETTRPRILFMSEMCILDRKSGAAISALSWLNVLQKNGFDCRSVSMSLFDGPDEYPFRQEIAPQIDPKTHIGKTLRTVIDGVEHNIFVTGTSRGQNIPRKLHLAFRDKAAEIVKQFKPDVVYGYSNPVLNPVRRLARKQGARNVFYLANGTYTEKKRAYFQEVDNILVPSAALGAHYKETMGLETEVTRDLVPQYIDPDTFSTEAKTATRGQGFVTLINPSPEKGGALLLRLAQMALTQAPELTFLTVESRGSRAFWEERRGINTAVLSNIWWLPKQKEIKRVYDRTSVLLAPSIWFEASARVVAEGQLCGIPVLATRRGGIPDQLNGGGFLFDIPQSMQDNPRAIPTAEEVQPWLDTVIRLMRDAEAYRQASDLALETSAPFRPDNRHRDLVEQFHRLAQKAPAS